MCDGDRHGEADHRHPGMPEVIAYCGVILAVWPAMWCVMTLAYRAAGAVMVCALLVVWLLWGVRIACRSAHWVARLIGILGILETVWVIIVCVTVAMS